MGRKKTTIAVMALVFSLFSHSCVWGANGEKKQEQPQCITVVKEEENAEARKKEYIPVLMYHHFAIRDMGDGNGIVTTTEELEEHLQYFKSQGYRLITLEELDNLLKRAERTSYMKGMGLGLDRKYLCITMDDGYYSNYELGYPLFEKYRSPASVFAVTDFVTEQYGVQKFTWKQAAEMEEGGWMKVYSHTADHVPMEAGQEDAFLASMQRSEAVLTEHLEKEHVKAMAYPNGRYTAESQRLLEEDGYRLQFTIERGVITRKTERNAIPRITIASGMNGREVVQMIERVAEQVFAAEREGK